MSDLSLTHSGPVATREESLRARAIQAQARPSPYGPDLDLTTFSQPVEQQRQRVEALCSLEQQMREAALLAGIDSEETGRAASYFQVDYSAIYERIQRRYQGQIELMTVTEALKSYDWLRDYWWQAVEVDQNKYTAAVELAQTGGFFLRVFAGQRVTEPIQACLLVQENNISQNVHNVILIEEGAAAQLITGCTLHPRVETGLHIGVTEVLPQEGSDARGDDDPQLGRRVPCPTTDRRHRGGGRDVRQQLHSAPSRTVGAGLSACLPSWSGCTGPVQQHHRGPQGVPYRYGDLCGADGAGHPSRRDLTGCRERPVHHVLAG